MAFIYAFAKDLIMSAVHFLILLYFLLNIERFAQAFSVLSHPTENINFGFIYINEKCSVM